MPPGGDKEASGCGRFRPAAVAGRSLALVGRMLATGGGDVVFPAGEDLLGGRVPVASQDRAGGREAERLLARGKGAGNGDQVRWRVLTEPGFPRVRGPVSVTVVVWVPGPGHLRTEGDRPGAGAAVAVGGGARGVEECRDAELMSLRTWPWVAQSSR